MVELTRIELVSESRSLRISTGVVCYLPFGRSLGHRKQTRGIPQ